jgi:polyhydroxyalkanoate synthesis regulator phasin
MDQRMMFKQMMEFQKGTFDNSFNAMAKLQEQGEEMMKAFLSQAAWMPEEGKKLVRDWMDAFKKGQKQLKELVDTSFLKVREFFETQQEKREQ